MAGRSYELIRCKTADELVDAISPTAKHFRNGDWIFRGQGRDLPLIPSAFREDRMPSMQSRSFDKWSYWAQARAELKLIRRFYKIADRSGLSIPEDSFHLRRLLDTIDHDREAFVKVWPPGELLALIALAQHHGVPTRLLDWSHSPWAAAYFAAENVIRFEAKELESCKIIVWAFDASIGIVVRSDHDDAEEPQARPEAKIEVVTTPYGNNRNLAAQRGVHLLYRTMEAHEPLKIIHREPFDHALRSTHIEAMADDDKALFKFVLPAEQGGRLLRLLAKHGATGATLFPGFDGVARAMAEETRWRKSSTLH